MQDLLWHWVPMFLACGKHKYAMHLSKFLQDLYSAYPHQLVHAIEMNWLCNPAGKSDGFQGVDWLVELNNLYTKVIPVSEKTHQVIDTYCNLDHFLQLKLK